MSDFIKGRIQQIYLLNNQVTILFSEELKRHPDFLNATKYPYLTKTIQNYVNIFANLYEGISSLAEDLNVYPIKILFRSFIEHSLMSLYLMDKIIHDESDITAEHFEKHYFIAEYLKYEKALGEVEAIKKGEDSGIDLVNYISSKYLEMKGFDKDNQREISKATKQFSVKNIVNYLYDNWKSKKTSEFDSSFFLNFLPDYAQLSSFTHGGPYAYKLVEAYKRDGNLDEQIDNALTISFVQSVAAKENLILVLTEKETAQEYLQFYKKKLKQYGLLPLKRNNSFIYLNSTAPLK